MPYSYASRECIQRSHSHKTVRSAMNIVLLHFFIGTRPVERPSSYGYWSPLLCLPLLWQVGHKTGYPQIHTVNLAIHPRIPEVVHYTGFSLLDGGISSDGMTNVFHSKLLICSRGLVQSIQIQSVGIKHNNGWRLCFYLFLMCEECCKEKYLKLSRY